MATIQPSFANAAEFFNSLLGEEESDWHQRNEAQHGFMNVVVAAAKRFDVQPLASLTVPRATKFSSDVYREFRSDLDHYLTQILLSNSARAKRDSVLLTPNFKTTIRTYVFNLRELIEKNENVDEAKRHELLKRLTDFEAALEEKRLNLLAVTALAITMLGAPGALGSSADIAGKLVTNILRTVGEAKPMTTQFAVYRPPPHRSRLRVRDRSSRNRISMTTYRSRTAFAVCRKHVSDSPC
ncbi:hypothetical protein [Bradyrhizobium sp. STM 3566]|uniref:hypothetical protein n=1 Tax=Bradyrhizobium sp. STM 3566 TaxID=578928 RepID=UPI00388DB521